MRKYLLLITFLFGFESIYAQHISFMGIQLGQSGKTVDRMLLQKGFKYDGNVTYSQNKRYKGPFWIFDEVIMSSEIENGKVTAINISPIIGTYEQMSDYNYLIRNLDKKYGRNHPISQYFKYSDIADNEGNYWKVSGGYIVAYYVNKPYSEKIMIYLCYIDNTNKRILLEQGRKRNKNNDL